MMVEGIKQYKRDGRAPIPVNESTSKVMSSIKGKDTKPELLLRKALWHLGGRGYRLHWRKAPGRPDITFVGRKVAVFVNGCFWHRCPNCNPSIPKANRKFWLTKFNKNKQRDLRKEQELRQLNWSVMIVWECQIKHDVVKHAREIMMQLDIGLNVEKSK